MNAGPSPREGVRTETPLHAKLSVSANGEHLITWGGGYLIPSLISSGRQKYKSTCLLTIWRGNLILCLYAYIAPLGLINISLHVERVIINCLRLQVLHDIC